MRKSVKKTSAVKPAWKKATKPPARKPGKPGRMSGMGRYVILAVLCGLAVKYLAAPAIDAVKHHPVFTVRHVVVEGADYIDPSRIIETAGIETGVNIFDVPIRPVVARLDDTFSAEDFTVFRRLPDTVAIRVKERKPVALLNMSELVGVDANGVPLPHVGASLAETLPIITGVDNVKSLSDSTVRDHLVKGLRLVERISKESPSVYKRIYEVNVANVSELGITLIDNGIEVIIGEDDWSRKIPMLEKVINRVPDSVEKVRAIDIRFAEKVFLRKK